MKHTLIKFAVVISILFFASGGSFGAEATLGVDTNSAYVWRGITFNDGLVLQPSLDVAKDGFGLNVWGNMDLDNYDGNINSGQFSEIDLTLSYSIPIEIIDLSVGYIEYLFPGAAAEAAREIYMSIGYSIPPVEGLSIGLDAYYEVDEIEDYYISMSISYGCNVNDKIGVEAGVSAGLIGEDYSVGADGGMNDYNFSLSASYAIDESLSISANINYTGSFDDTDVLPEYDNVGFAAYDVEAYGGISISYAF